MVVRTAALIMFRDIWHAWIITFPPRRWQTTGSELDESRIEVPSGAESEGVPAVTLCARQLLERPILATGGIAVLFIPRPRTGFLGASH